MPPAGAGGNRGGAELLAESPHLSNPTPSSPKTPAVVSRCAAREPTSSRQVAWYEVYEFLTWAAQRYGVDMWDWPEAGTPAWNLLDNSDPRRMLGALAGGVYWATRIDTLQAELAEASQQISTMANWGEVGQQIRGRKEFFAEHPWLRRAAS
jgi:hypothetical protein